jgi:arylsulfatase A-like enzyme
MKRITTAALLLILLATGVASAQRGATPPRKLPHVLMIGIDTLRGDHLACSGNDWIRTPNIDALAADGVLFTRCFSTAPWTLPSFASIFTGLTPYRHGAVGSDYQRLADEHHTLTEFFDVAGYKTHGYVSINYLSEPFGMGQGFNGAAPPGLDPDLDRASRITWLGLETMNLHDMDRPLFMFLHYFDVHAPYTPPEPYAGMYYEGEARGAGEPVLDFLKSDANAARNRDSGMYDWLEGVTDLDFGVKEYAAGVTFVDDHVGQIVADLKRRGLYDDMMIVLVSDHGEHLGEHDLWFTHAEPYQECLHVPLMIKFPEGHFAGTVVDAPVSTMDLMPTMLETVNIRPPDMDGRSLLPLCAGRSTSVGSLLVAEQGGHPAAFSKTLIDWPWKLFYSRAQDVESYRLFNLNADPDETEDLAEKHAAKARSMQRRMWRVFDPDSPVVERGTPISADIDEETKRRLEALGY